MESNRAMLEASATAWLQKRELGPWNEGEQAELMQWLEASTANRITFLRLEAAWEEMGRLKVLTPGLPRGAVPTPEQLRLTPTPRTNHLSFESGEGKAHPNSRRVSGLVPWALAASLLLVVGLAGIGYWQFIAPFYRTPVGGLTSIPLKDGSSVTLNTASRIRIEMTKTQRHIELAQGEAFFDVAQDPHRPFTVTAGDQTITVLGTAFSVRRNGRDLQVTVTEGKVKIDLPRSPSGEGPGARVLAAGTVAYTGPKGIEIREKPVAEIEESLSWRTGYLIFNDTALPGVIAEFNRYNEREIAIEDPAVNDIQLTGKFRSTNVDALVRLLEKSFRVTVRHDGDRILLSSQALASE